MSSISLFFSKAVLYTSSFIWTPVNPENKKRKTDLISRTNALKNCILEMQSQEKEWKSAQRDLAETLCLTIRYLKYVPQTSNSLNNFSTLIENIESDVCQQVDLFLPEILNKNLLAVSLAYLGHHTVKVIGEEKREAKMICVLFQTIASKTRTAIAVVETATVVPKKIYISEVAEDGSVTNYACQKKFKNGKPYLSSLEKSEKEKHSVVQNAPSNAKTIEEYHKFLSAFSARSNNLPALAVQRMLKNFFLNNPGQYTIRVNNDFLVMREQSEKDLPRLSSLKLNEQMVYTSETIEKIGTDDQERLQYIFEKLLQECESNFVIVENLITLFTQGCFGSLTKEIYRTFSNHPLNIFVVACKKKDVALYTKNNHITIIYTISFKLNRLEDGELVHFKTIRCSRVTIVAKEDLKTGTVNNASINETYNLE